MIRCCNDVLRELYQIKELYRAGLLIEFVVTKGGEVTNGCAYDGQMKLLPCLDYQSFSLVFVSKTIGKYIIT